MAVASAPDKLSWATGRKAIFLYNLLILLFLVGVLFYYLHTTTEVTVNGVTTKVSTGFLLKDIPSDLFIAFYAVWFGALGGVVISLKGVFDHSSDWQPSLALWHYGRPFSAAIAGGVTYVLLLAVNPNSQPTTGVLEAAAFVLGIQEKRFFNFLAQVASLVVAVPSQDDDALVVSGVQPDRGEAGTELKISGSGFKPGTRVSIGGGTLRDVVIGPEGKEIVGRLNIDVPAADTMLDVRVENADGPAYVLRQAFTVQPPQAPSQPVVSAPPPAPEDPTSTPTGS